MSLAHDALTLAGVTAFIGVALMGSDGPGHSRFGTRSPGSGRAGWDRSAPRSAGFRTFRTGTGTGTGADTGADTGPGTGPWPGRHPGRADGTGAPVGGRFRLGTRWGTRGRARTRTATWARGRDLGPLVLPRGRDAGPPPPGRLVLGRVGRHTVAAERTQSVVVFGPTRSHKTSGLAVPAILGWDGPVLAASVKTDLIEHTLGHRGTCGTVQVFDPSGSTGLRSARWSPLPVSRTWSGARRAAAGLTEGAKASVGTMSDGDFWYATATRMLAPLLFAAATGGRTMADVIRWVDTQEEGQVIDLLLAAGVPEALDAARSNFGKEDRQRSSIYTTVETVLEPFADSPGGPDSPVGLGGLGGPDSPDSPGGPDSPDSPGGLGWIGDGHESDGRFGGDAQPQPATDRFIDPGRLVGGANTLYVCAPAHDQRRLTPLFSSVVRQVVEFVYDRVAQTRRPLDPPLLVVLDEAANIAPLADLDALASTAAGHGIQLVTIWHDLAQINARYGVRAATVVNNHRAKLFLSGISDPSTLDYASQLIGDEEVMVPTVTDGGRSGPSTSRSPSVRRLAPPDGLRRIPPGEGVLVYGDRHPAKVRLRTWFDDPWMSGRARIPPGDGGTGGAG